MLEIMVKLSLHMCIKCFTIKKLVIVLYVRKPNYLYGTIKYVILFYMGLLNDMEPKGL